MSYEPTNWVTGDIVTAEKLNKIEQGIVDAKGYGEELQLLTNETVNTVSQSSEIPFALGVLTYSSSISADTIKVTFEGQEYVVQKTESSSGVPSYGYLNEQEEPDFSILPFVLVSQPSEGNLLATENAGNYSIKIEEYSMIPTDEFKIAVKNSIPSRLLIYLNVNDNTPFSSATFQQINEAFTQGADIIAFYGGTTTGNISRSFIGEGTPAYKIDFTQLAVVQDAVEAYIEYFTVTRNNEWAWTYKAVTLQTT